MNLLVVLVRTHSPGNLGGAARAAKNFGARLTLCDPRADRGHPDARAFASGAEDVLDGAAVVPSLDEVVDRAGFVVGLSSLRGRLASGLPPPTQWSKLRTRRARSETVALVFGPERSGLTTEELRSCDARLSIPTASEFRTLNLAQAVAVTLALAQPRRGTTKRSEKAPEGEAPSPEREVSLLLKALGETLQAAGYPGRGRSKDALYELEAFLRRGEPSRRETALLLGALAALRRAIRGDADR